MTVEYNDTWITEMEWKYFTFYKGAFCYFLTFVKNLTNPPAVLDINSSSFSVTFIVLTGRDQMGQIVLLFLLIPCKERTLMRVISASSLLVSQFHCINGGLMKKIHCPHLPVNQYEGIISEPTPMQNHTWC